MGPFSSTHQLQMPFQVHSSRSIRKTVVRICGFVQYKITGFHFQYVWKLDFGYLSIYFRTKDLLLDIYTATCNFLLLNND